MSYQIIPNLIFVFSVFGIILLIAKNLPKAQAEPKEQSQAESSLQNLSAKGLPAQAFSKIISWIKFSLQKLWHFALEAKDLRPVGQTGRKIKKILQAGINTAKAGAPLLGLAARPKTEADCLRLIKKEPKKLSHYDTLGRLYLEAGSFSEAQDVYIYLTGHAPQNADFHARLGFCAYQLKNFKASAEAYSKAVALDSTHPNRYYNLGQSLKAQGEIQAAREAFSKALELEPYNLKYESALKNSETNPPNLT